MKRKRNRLPSYMTIASHIECGLLHTGLPSCCVAFFVTEWQTYSLAERDAYHRQNNAKKEVGYVRCPQCLERNVRVQVKPCACIERFVAGVVWQKNREKDA